MVVCNTNTKGFSSKQLCVQKGMGGHVGELINVIIRNRVYCGKLINGVEYEFYTEMKKLIRDGKISTLWKKYLPKMVGICTVTSKQYMMIENVFSVFGKSDYDFVDIKLGYRSTHMSRHHDIIRTIRMGILDRVTTSHKRGFRIEGGTIKPGSSKLTKQKTLPTELWDWFFKSSPSNLKLKNKLLNSLLGLKKLLKVNAQNPKFGSVGSSVLIGVGAGKIVVKLVDFGNSGTIIGDSRDLRQMAINTYRGICELVNTYLEYHRMPIYKCI